MTKDYKKYIKRLLDDFSKDKTEFVQREQLFKQQEAETLKEIESMKEQNSVLKSELKHVHGLYQDVRILHVYA